MMMMFSSPGRVPSLTNAALINNRKPNETSNNNSNTCSSSNNHKYLSCISSSSTPVKRSAPINRPSMLMLTPSNNNNNGCNVISSAFLSQERTTSNTPKYNNYNNHHLVASTNMFPNTSNSSTMTTATTTTTTTVIAAGLTTTTTATTTTSKDNSNNNNNVDPIERLLFEVKWRLLHDPTKTHRSKHHWADLELAPMIDANLLQLLRGRIQIRIQKGGCITESMQANKYFFGQKSHLTFEDWCHCLNSLDLCSEMKEKDAWRLFELADLDRDGQVCIAEFTNVILGVQS